MAEKTDALGAGQLFEQLDIEEVRLRAYELWEQYGRPEGGEEEFWLKAEREIYREKGLDRTSSETSEPASGSD